MHCPMHCMTAEGRAPWHQDPDWGPAPFPGFVEPWVQEDKTGDSSQTTHESNGTAIRAIILTTAISSHRTTAAMGF